LRPGQQALRVRVQQQVLEPVPQQVPGLVQQQVPQPVWSTRPKRPLHWPKARW
jgi:hypothetical protein